MKKTLNKYYLIFLIIVIILFIILYYYFYKKNENFESKNRFYFSIEGTDYQNDSITYYKGPFEECHEQCDNTPNCKGFILDLNNRKNCWLKSSFEKPRQDYSKKTYYYGPTPLLPGSPGNIV
jgi:hypothetical protein